MSVYENFIDELVEKSKQSNSKMLIDEGIYSRGLDGEKYNKFVSSLSIEQRELLAEMFKLEREGSVHEVLAELTWFIDCKNVTLNQYGKVVETGYEGGLHQDYIGRKSGNWEWPR